MNEVKIKDGGDVVAMNVKFTNPILCRFCNMIISVESVANQRQEKLVHVCDECSNLITGIVIKAITEDYKNGGVIRNLIRRQVNLGTTRYR